MPFGLGYYLSYLYRTMNAVLAPQLVAEVGLSPSELGFLTSVYFIAFASVQIPIGVLLDRLGPRRVQTVLLLIAAAGGVLFGVGESISALSFGRAMIGIGVAGCFMAALKANALWWPADRLPLVNGITASFGSFGALSATMPVELALGFFEWRQIFFAIALVTVAVAVLIWFLVPEKAASDGKNPGISEQASEILNIYKDVYFWRLGCLIIVGFASYMAFQTLWAGPWLRDVAGYDRLGVANGLLMIQLGMFAGVLVGGILADRLARTGAALARVVKVGTALFMLSQVLLIFELTAIAGWLWAAFGFFGSTLFLCYSLYAQNYGAALIGRVNTANNVLLFSAAFFAQWGVGAIIGEWPRSDTGGYDPEAYRVAFVAVLVLQAMAFTWFVWPHGRRGT